jgi:GT2 family glycosyltransferase
MTAEALVAVVVVSYETREELLACLASVEREAGLPVETVVVDNASGDGSAAAVRERHARVLVIGNAENAGFGRACNQGAAATGAPYLLFLNSDAALTPGALPALVAVLEARPEVVAVGPRTRHADGTIQVSTGPDLTPWAERRQGRLVRGVRARSPWALAAAEARHSREHEPDWLSGSCLLVRRTAFAAAGGFDEGFFLYEEDADLCRRLRQAGGRVVFTPTAEVRHHLGRSMARAPERARLAYHRSHLRYYAKHAGPVARGLLRLRLLAAAAARAAAGATTEGRALLALALRGR